MHTSFQWIFRSAERISVGHFESTTSCYSNLIDTCTLAENLHFSAIWAFARGGNPPFRQGSGTPVIMKLVCADRKYRPTPGIEPGQLTHSVDYPIAGACVYQPWHPRVNMAEMLDAYSGFRVVNSVCQLSWFDSRCWPIFSIHTNQLYNCNRSLPLMTYKLRQNKKNHHILTSQLLFSNLPSIL